MMLYQATAEGEFEKRILYHFTAFAKFWRVKGLRQRDSVCSEF